MKFPSCYLFLFIPVLWFPGFAPAQTASHESAELLNARAAYEDQLATATKTVQARYVTYLQSLLKTLIEKGDLTGALAIQTELAKFSNANDKAVEVAPALSKFNETSWHSDDGDSTIEFKANGKYHEHFGKTTLVGTWKPISEFEVEVSLTDGSVFHVKLDPVKDTLLSIGGKNGREEGWHRKK